jgi:hypothetical protein
MTIFPISDTIRSLVVYITLPVTMISTSIAMNRLVTKYPTNAASTLKLSCD